MFNQGYSWVEASARIGMSEMALRHRAKDIEHIVPFRRGQRPFKMKPTIFLPEDPCRLAYIAGIMDGEGHISIVHSPRENIIIGVTNTSKDLMELLLKIGGSYGEKKPSHLSKKLVYAWRLYSRSDVEAFLKAIEPFMLIKKVKAQRALKILQGYRTAWLNGVPVTMQNSSTTKVDLAS